jgi:hypothetical protein
MEDVDQNTREAKQKGREDETLVFNNMISTNGYKASLDFCSIDLYEKKQCTRPKKSNKKRQGADGKAIVESTGRNKRL